MYDDSLKQTQTSDIHSFMLCYNVSGVLHRTAFADKALILPCQMTGLTPKSYWNHLKGVGDSSFRLVKTISLGNIGKNTVVSIINRHLSIQISNAVAFSRLYIARHTKIMLHRHGILDGISRIYSNFRNRVSKSEQFDYFVSFFCYNFW